MILAETVTLDCPECKYGDWLDAWAVFDSKVDLILATLSTFRATHQLGNPSVRYVLRSNGDTRFVPYSDMVARAVSEMMSGHAIWVVCHYDPEESSELWTVDRTDGIGWGC